MSTSSQAPRSEAPRSTRERLARDFFSSEFLRFLGVGAIAALANVGSRRLLGYGLSYEVSIVVAYVVGMAVAYLLNRWLVFGRGERKVAFEAMWFVLVNVAGILQTLGVSLALAPLIDGVVQHRSTSETLAHAVGVAAPAFSSFLGHKYLTFRRKLNPSKADAVDPAGETG